MNRAKDQLPEETAHPHLAAFLQSGGTLEVGEDFSTGAFARIRKSNRVVVVDSAYRDLTAILKEMDSQARRFMERQA
jgi:hypothetical protein